MKQISLIIFLLSFYIAGATHYRSAEISSRLLEPLKLEVSVITYAKWSGASSLADRDSVEVHWGDGSSSMLFRANGPDVGSPGAPGSNGIPDGEMVESDLKKNVYRGVHQYSTLPPNGMYVVSFTDVNRMASINNIDNSVNVPMYVEHKVNIAAMAALGSTNTPVFTVIPFQYGNVNDTLLYNVGVYDADRDGLEFSLVTPMQDSAMDVPGYRWPDVACAGSSFSINAQNGDIHWINPCQMGVYCIATQVNEYRNGQLLSTSTRDMQFIILSEPNNPPVINKVMDTIIAPGTMLEYAFSANDDAGDSVVLEMFAPQYTMANNGPVLFTGVNNMDEGTFTWLPDTSWTNSYPYIFTIRAKDDHTVGPDTARQATFSTFRVWVADSNTVILNEPVINEESSLSVYPNPAQHYITVDCTQPINKVRVYSAEGRLLFNSPVTEQPQKIDIFGYTPGLYWVQIEAKGRLYTHKFVKYTD